MAERAQGYTAVAIILHWAIAIAILGMIPLGWWMGDALAHRETQAQAVAAFQLHKSIGLTILFLSLLRLGWRLAHKPPPLPAHAPAWEALAAKSAHWAFYFIIIVMPLTGWLYVSTAWSIHDQRALNVPTLYFGLFQVPHLFGLADWPNGARESLAVVLETIHAKLAWGANVLLVLHIGAALKHHFVDKDEVLTHMIPALKAPIGQSQIESSPARAPALITGFAAIAIAAASAIFVFANPPSGPTERGPPFNSNNTDSDGGSPRGSEVSPVGQQAETTEPTLTPAANAAPSSWRVDHRASSIRFSGAHAGVHFSGAFARWSADIRFDPNNIGDSTATVTIQTGSAADGVPLHDQTMPEAEWFDVANHPTASFHTTRISDRGEGRYEADGVLTLKRNALDLDLPFTLRIDGNGAVMDGIIEIDRRAADLGMESDPNAEYVSPTITVQVHVETTRAP